MSADHQATVSRVTADNLVIDRKSADSSPILVPYKPRPIFLLHSCLIYFELSAFS